MAMLNNFNVRKTGLTYDGFNSVADVYNYPYVTPGWPNSQYGADIVEVNPNEDVYGLGLGLDLDYDSQTGGVSPDTEPEPAQIRDILNNTRGLGVILLSIIGLLLIT